MPGSPQAKAAGVKDSIEIARDYALGVVGNRAERALIEAYLNNGPEMVSWLAKNSHVDFMVSPPSSDWYPDVPGAVDFGRLLSPTEYDGKKLGKNFDRLQKPREEFNAPAE